MIGLLNAPEHTKLYKRLKDEGRLLDKGTGDSMGFSTNIVPKMGRQRLIEGYEKTIYKVYSLRPYYRRALSFLREYKPLQKRTFHFKFSHLKAFLGSVIRLGIMGKERFHYWKLLFWTAFRRPRLFPLALTFTIYGFHYRKFFNRYL